MRLILLCGSRSMSILNARGMLKSAAATKLFMSSDTMNMERG